MRWREESIRIHQVDDVAEALNRTNEKDLAAEARGAIRENVTRVEDLAAIAIRDDLTDQIDVPTVAIVIDHLQLIGVVHTKNQHPANIQPRRHHRRRAIQAKVEIEIVEQDGDRGATKENRINQADDIREIVQIVASVHVTDIVRLRLRKDHIKNLHLASTQHPHRRRRPHRLVALATRATQSPVDRQKLAHRNPSRRQNPNPDPNRKLNRNLVRRALKGVQNRNPRQSLNRQ
jgi:hypothetical protein